MAYLIICSIIILSVIFGIASSDYSKLKGFFRLTLCFGFIFLFMAFFISDMLYQSAEKQTEAAATYELAGFEATQDIDTPRRWIGRAYASSVDVDHVITLWVRPLGSTEDFSPLAIPYSQVKLNNNNEQVTPIVEKYIVNALAKEDEWIKFWFGWPGETVQYTITLQGA